MEEDHCLGTCLEKNGKHVGASGEQENRGKNRIYQLPRAPVKHRENKLSSVSYIVVRSSVQGWHT